MFFFLLKRPAQSLNWHWMESEARAQQNCYVIYSEDIESSLLTRSNIFHWRENLIGTWHNSHIFQVWRIYGDIWRDGQTASYCPCGKMKSPITFHRDTFLSARLLNLFSPECSYFQGCEGSGILGHTVEERSLKRWVGMGFPLSSKKSLKMNLMRNYTNFLFRWEGIQSHARWTVPPHSAGKADSSCLHRGGPPRLQQSSGHSYAAFHLS